MQHTLLIAAALCGLVLVPTARAQDLYVGSNTPSNTLDLTNGTNTYAYIYIGYLSGSYSNTLNVNNAGTLLNSSYLFVGYYGTGTLNVEAGGVVSNTGGVIGNATNSTGVATVTGSGSQWNNSSSLYVGYSGTGTLNVEAGGV
ncbi:MAG: hypothetical protein ACO3XN_07995, partial [Chthoniobacterales bacterium]